MNELLTAFGVDPAKVAQASGQASEEGSSETAEETAEEAAGEATTATEGTAPKPTGADDGDKSTSEGEPTPADLEEAKRANRAAQAFAAMRVQNKRYEQLIKGIANVLGVDTNTKPEELQEIIQQKIIDAQAKQQNIDPAILQRLQVLEEMNMQYQQEERRRQAALGFQRVKDRFQLDDKALQAFADQLVSDGLNPYEEPLDLPTLYLSYNYEKLIAAARAQGAQQEAQRALKANTHGSTPQQKSGQPQGDPPKINTIADLNKWFAQNAAAKD